MIEWFEFNRLLGVTEFNIYDANLQIDDAMKAVFKYYKHQRILRYVSHPTPFPNVPESHCLLFFTSLGDCLYRNMYRYKYIIAIDFDEIIVPVKMRSYKELLQHYENSTHHNPLKLSLQFDSHGYYKDQIPDLTQPRRLPSMQYRRHSFDQLRPKLIHNPRLCHYMVQHFCYPKKSKPVNRRSVASVHHYKSYCLEPHTGTDPGPAVRKQCRKQQNATSVDEAVLMFKDELLQRVDLVYSQLGMSN